MFNSIGNGRGIGGPLRHAVPGENFIRHIGNDKLIFDFKSGSGTTVKDRSREGNDGTLGAGAGAPTWKRNSLYFDGTATEYIDCGLDYTFANCFFVFRIKPVNAINNRYLFDQSADSRGVLIGYQDGYLNMYSSGYPTGTAGDTQIETKINIWQDIVIGVNGTKVYGYRNGVEIFKKTGTWVSMHNDLVVGNHANKTLGYNGYIKNVRILNRCLSGIEAQNEYLSQKFRGNN
jgi:hypothetical protein